ncbi:unnamed protein product [Schistosoma intercalatum]|nr:unnamed protein product [Schistosoma intercalatum]CAH8579757.1 unnamed protein product [Schistosoma intercalatum]
MQLNAEYARELRAVFKILEFSIGVSLIVSIIVADHYRITATGGLLAFFALVGALISLFFFVIHLCGLIYKIRGPVTLIEFITIKFCAILAFIAMIIAAATGGGSSASIASALLKVDSMKHVFFPTWDSSVCCTCTPMFMSTTTCTMF